jgi:hypothetical protein
MSTRTGGDSRGIEVADEFRGLFNLDDESDDEDDDSRLGGSKFRFPFCGLNFLIGYCISIFNMIAFNLVGRIFMSYPHSLVCLMVHPNRVFSVEFVLIQPLQIEIKIQLHNEFILLLVLQVGL